MTDFKSQCAFNGKIGAAAGAASKRAKRQKKIDWLTIIIEAEKLDMTPTLALRLIKGATGRGASMLFLNEAYGKKDRTAGNKSPDFDRVNQIIDKYKHLLKP
jgi:hypothetical protein